MSLYLPPWLLWLAVGFVWVLGAYGRALLRRMDGTDRNEIVIVSLLNAAAWPLFAVWMLVSSLFKRQS